TIVARRSTLQLVRQSESPQGKPVRKVTVFDNSERARVRVRAHLLQDERGNEICSAYINDVQLVGSVAVPTRMVLSWPGQRLERKMKLNNPTINRLDPSTASRLFTRPTLANVQAYDLTRGLDAATTQLAPVGGTLPR